MSIDGVDVNAARAQPCAQSRREHDRHLPIRHTVTPGVLPGGTTCRAPIARAPIRRKLPGPRLGPRRRCKCGDREPRIARHARLTTMVRRIDRCTIDAADPRYGPLYLATTSTPHEGGKPRVFHVKHRVKRMRQRSRSPVRDQPEHPHATQHVPARIDGSTPMFHVKRTSRANATSAHATPMSLG